MPPLPRLHRYCTALRLPCPLGPRSGSPRSGLPPDMIPPRRTGASQVAGPSSSCVPRPYTPPDVPPPRPSSRRRHCCLQALEYPGHQECVIFGAVSPAAHTLAALRTNDPVTKAAVRTRFRPAGLSFDRAGFAPAGRLTEFQGVSPPPFPSDQPILAAPQDLTPINGNRVVFDPPGFPTSLRRRTKPMDCVLQLPHSAADSDFHFR
jgi:hypothetical protein